MAEETRSENGLRTVAREGDCIMRTMSIDHGDKKEMWDRTNEDEVACAKKTFDALRKKGYIAWSVKNDGSKAEMMTEFDPHAESMILSPPVRGG